MKELKDYIIEKKGSVVNPSDINQLFIDGQKELKRWKRIMKMEFNELGVFGKGEHQFYQGTKLLLDIRIDAVGLYEYGKHEPCVYFRVGPNDNDFLPMIIDDDPYIPIPFEQTISDDELLWIYNFVKDNKHTLLDCANEKIGYTTLFSLLNENDQSENGIIEEVVQIPSKETGLTRKIWVGPFGDKHYMRIKIENPIGSRISKNWSSLSIPNLKLTPKNAKIPPKELRKIEEFALRNQTILTQFAKAEISLETLLKKIVKP